MPGVNYYVCSYVISGGCIQRKGSFIVDKLLLCLLAITDGEIVHLTFKIAGLKNSMIKILSLSVDNVLTNSNPVVFSGAGVSESCVGFV